jgi:hypothetical protein
VGAILTGVGLAGYPGYVTYFQRHPKIHAAVHWTMSGVGFILATQDQLLAATRLVPPGSKIPRFVGYGLAVLAFSKIFLGRVQVAGGEVAPAPAAADALAAMVPSTGAPVTEVPKSEAITVVERNIDPSKSK